MKFICDVHISYKLVKFLNDAGHEAIHVNQILDKWFSSDQGIAKYADSNAYIVISKDSDFRDSYFISKSPHKIIRICLGNISNQRLIELFAKNMENLEQELSKEFVYLEIHDSLITVFS
jgi:predicted nuclease of predicted toxin-antitoxin system